MRRDLAGYVLFGIAGDVEVSNSTPLWQGPSRDPAAVEKYPPAELGPKTGGC